MLMYYVQKLNYMQISTFLDENTPLKSAPPQAKVLAPPLNTEMRNSYLNGQISNFSVLKGPSA